MTWTEMVNELIDDLGPNVELRKMVETPVVKADTKIGKKDDDIKIDL